ncbi:MAG TPA: bacillithiol biosynthesis cysteine-adding enzyme BshC [Acidobacteriaceae bacterium]|nr:bacillithiol biosynthesis cysteine-adding enzyme BshC [Acidobacteriaceae bacterium]
MSTECYPMTTLPNTTRLFRDFLAMGEGSSASLVMGWYGADPLGHAWMRPAAMSAHADALADALEIQSRSFEAGQATLANIAKLRAGARAVVTGQQVGLLGGPLLTLLKAATAIARAKQATVATGVQHVPIFWLATEDHDLEEVNQVTLLTKAAVDKLSLGMKPSQQDAPVGDAILDGDIDGLLEQASELLGYAPVCDLLRECYGAESGGDSRPTFGSAFARLMTRLFASHGLIVMDAAGKDFHALGAAALRYAIEHSEELEVALLARARELEAAGYHAQVLVKPGSSLLFLISDAEANPGVKHRQALRRTADGTWKAGTGPSAKSFSTAQLLAILAETPERVSPNALLRPVFQDTILPTTAYIGGPSEVAYFAQSAVLYESMVGRITPVLPRLSATLIEPAIATVMQQHEVSLPDAMCRTDELAQRLGARAMPIEAKRRLAAAGNTLDEALTAAEDYLGTLDASLGRSAEVAASKMRYQMNRLRRLAATFEVNKEASLRKHAEAMTLHLFPEGHPQERVIAGVWLLAAYENAGLGEATELIARLVDEAANQCPGHIVIRL